jgi:two-component system, LytTR family, sensor kinase
MKFADRLTVVIDVAPETLDAAVPHLLVQPLVENAVRHGAGKMSSGGVIQVSTAVRGRSLIIRVEDNGPGINSTSVKPRLGLGLATTRERLRTLYGDNQRLAIEKREHGGTVVEVEIPLQLLPVEDAEPAEAIHLHSLS